MNLLTSIMHWSFAGLLAGLLLSLPLEGRLDGILMVFLALAGGWLGVVIYCGDRGEEDEAP